MGGVELFVGIDVDDRVAGGGARRAGEGGKHEADGKGSARATWANASS